MRNSLVVSAGKSQMTAVVCLINQVQRFQFQGLLKLDRGLVKSPEPAEEKSVPIVAIRVVRVDSYSLPVFALGSGEIVIVAKNSSESRMSFRKVVIYRKRLECRSARFRRSLTPQDRVGVGNYRFRHIGIR